MNDWLLNIVGVIFMGLLIELISPNGKTKNFIKSIFAIILIYVIILPLAGLTNNSISLHLDDYKFANNTDLLFVINSAKNENLTTTLILHMQNKGIEGVDVTICSNLSSDENEIENVYVDTTNLVLSKNITHINKYEVILKVVQNFLNIEKEKIIFIGT